MRMVFGLVLVLGVGLAGLAVYMARGYFSTYQNELARQRAMNSEIVETSEVFVLTRRIRYGERIRLSDVRPVKWPANAVPAGSFPSMDMLFPKGPDKLRTALRTMESGEAVLMMKVTSPGADAGITSRLSKGMRAFTIKVDVTSGVSGFLRPGDKVDVYWTGQVRNARSNGDVTKLIEPGVHLVAVDQSSDDDRNGPSIARTVTVEASPRQVAALAQAQATGRLSLSLVGADDNTISGPIQVNQDQLLGIKAAEVAVVQQQRVCTIKTRRGAEVVMIPIPCTN
jgi:pilus assembly protein CpaB